MTDQNLVGVGDEVVMPSGNRADVAGQFKGRIIVTYGPDIWDACKPQDLHFDGKPVTGFREVRAEVIERESAYLYVGSELVWSFRYAKDAKSAADAINKALGVE